MKNLLKTAVRESLAPFGLRLVHTRRDWWSLISQEELGKIKNDLIESLVNFEIPAAENGLHKRISSQVIASYKAAKDVSHDAIYDANELWADVYRSSPYIGPESVMAKQEVATALFYGCRCGWLEGDSPAYILKRWLVHPETFGQNIITLIKGRSFLRSRWRQFPQHVDLLNQVFDIGQPLQIRFGEEVISDCDTFFFYLTRIASFLDRKQSDRLVCLDLGSGSGRFAWVFKKFFPDSTIVCCDIPETLLGAAYRLSMYFPESRHLYFDPLQISGQLQDLTQYDFVYLPGFAMEYLAEESLDLVVNTMSLSEMKGETIKRYISLIQKTLKNKLGLFYTVNRSAPQQNREMHVDIPLADFPISDSVFERLSYIKHFAEIDNFFRGSVQNGEAAFRMR